jgi:hypothetical protein
VSCAIIGIVHSALVQSASMAARIPALRKIFMFIEISPRACAPDDLLQRISLLVQTRFQRKMFCNASKKQEI